MPKGHLVINAHFPAGNIVEAAFHKLSLQRGNMIDKEFAFNMIVFMKDNSGSKAGEGLGVLYKMLIAIPQGDRLLAVNIFPDLRNTEATFVIRPLLSFQFSDMCIDKHAFKTWIAGILGLFFLIHIPEHLLRIHHEQADIPVNLRRCQSYSVAGIHGFPHIFHQFGQAGVFRGNIGGYFTKDRVSVCYNGKYQGNDFKGLQIRLFCAFSGQSYPRVMNLPI